MQWNRLLLHVPMTSPCYMNLVLLLLLLLLGKCDEKLSDACLCTDTSISLCLSLEMFKIDLETSSIYDARLVSCCIKLVYKCLRVLID